MRTFHRSDLASLLIAPLALATLAASACDNAAVAPEPPGILAVSDVEREANPNVAPADASELVAGNTRFAVDAYHEIRHLPGNLFYSPFSVSTAMAMTYGGARGDTETQMADVLHYTLPGERLHSAFNWLDHELDSRGQGAQGADGNGFRLNVINNVFGQEGYEFVPEYLDLLAKHYGSGMSLLDFFADAEGARQIINDWVASVTEDRITELLPQGSIDPSTRLVLTNAVYFNAAWKNPFIADLTTPGPFQTDTGTVDTPMMSGEVEMTEASGDGFVALGLPYDGDQLDMVMIVPDAGLFDDIEANLSAETLEQVFASLTPSQYGMLRMPSFSFRSKLDMVETFQSLGLSAAFDSSADFSGINGQRNLQITGIFHEAFINLNEAGTEAAAATAVVVGETSVPQTFSVDRPFLFAIRDIPTGTILFLGRVLDPTAS